MKYIGIIYLLIIIFGGYGWIHNIVSIVYSDHLTGLLIARVAGIFIPPLGAVLGYF